MECRVRSYPWAVLTDVDVRDRLSYCGARIYVLQRTCGSAVLFDYLGRHGRSMITAAESAEADFQDGRRFAIANNCAHPKEQIKPDDVERLIKRGRELASNIL